MSAIPNMRVYLPSDRFQTAKLIEALLQDEKPAYLRVGRNPVEDIYTEENCPFEMDKATVLAEGADVALIACGEMVRPALDAAALLKAQGISATVLDMYCVKPLDNAAVIKAAQTTKSSSRSRNTLRSVVWAAWWRRPWVSTARVRYKNLSLPDAPVITGTSKEVFDYYGLNAAGIAKTAAELLNG